jgi:hypothetical protein
VTRNKKSTSGRVPRLRIEVLSNADARSVVSDGRHLYGEQSTYEQSHFAR